jgi:hypothetical protein
MAHHALPPLGIASGATLENMKNRDSGRKRAECFIKTIAQETGKMAGSLRDAFDEL